MFDAANFWADSDVESIAGGMDRTETAAGVSEENILAWEQQHSVKLPAMLREVLAVSNGGSLRDEDIRILRLAEFQPLPDEFWARSHHEETDFADRGLVIEFAKNAVGDSYLLDFNANTATGEPRVCLHTGDGGEIKSTADSVGDWFESLMQLTAEPTVDFDATLETFVSVLAEETVDLSDHSGGALEQFLGRDQDLRYFLLTRETTPERVTVTRTFVPTPLKCRMVPGRDDPKTYRLELHPDDADGLQHQESIRVADGKWKNQVNHGVSTYVAIESPDRDELMDARVQMVGPETAKRDAEREACQAEVQSETAAMTPDEQQTAGMQLLEKMHELPVDSDGLEDVPDQAMEIVEGTALNGQLAGAVEDESEVVEYEEVEEVIEYEEVEIEYEEIEEVFEYEEVESNTDATDNAFAFLDQNAADENTFADMTDDPAEVVDSVADAGVVEIVEDDLEFFDDEPSPTPETADDDLEFFDVDDDDIEFIDDFEDIEVLTDYDSASAGDPSRVLYKSPDRVFLKTDLGEFMSAPDQERLAEVESRMQALGFERLGDVTVVVLSMRAYGGDERMWGIAYGVATGLAYEFFTRFDDGSSITTTTSATGEPHPDQGIFINVFADQTVEELQAEHIRAVQAHAINSGATALAHESDLTAFARAIDEFMDRHPNNPSTTTH
ncbi:MAG: SMI1/KNR4 family protein [Planctomycetota bacterium]|nr:SMI1/KNR4 family protein [Planctomycetota bacterium]